MLRVFISTIHVHYALLRVKSAPVLFAIFKRFNLVEWYIGRPPFVYFLFTSVAVSLALVFLLHHIHSRELDVLDSRQDHTLLLSTSILLT